MTVFCGFIFSSAPFMPLFFPPDRDNPLYSRSVFLSLSAGIFPLPFFPCSPLCFFPLNLDFFFPAGCGLLLSAISVPDSSVP